jgi:hypothetical protein
MAHWDCSMTSIQTKFHPKLAFGLSTLLELNLWELMFKLISFMTGSRRICPILFAPAVSDDTDAPAPSSQ